MAWAQAQPLLGMGAKLCRALYLAACRRVGATQTTLLATTTTWPLSHCCISTIAMLERVTIYCMGSH